MTDSGDNIIKPGAYAQNDALTEFVIPEGTEDIGEVAFFGCTNLKKVGFPQTLKFIREEAFGESGVESVILPETLELIGEKAFFSCPDLKYIEVPGEKTFIGLDAFVGCPKLLEGYVAVGYPQVCNPPEELLFTLLWCTCPSKHGEKTSRHARAFISENEALIMERILKFNNTAAMSGLVSEKLLRQENIGKYIEEANLRKETEIVAMLLSARGKDGGDTGEFEL
ncbi:MAG: leucine-rich repeat domain-containing protein [Lachnospiraceae bacterium]|nr:leucine-rich repeat domain-containing protein [Lachnospiraceae bacterium]